MAKEDTSSPTPPPTSSSWWLVDPDDSGINRFDNLDFSVGCQFSIAAPITVTKLSRFFIITNTTFHNIWLWDDLGNPLGTVSVATTGGGVISNPLSGEVLLPAGTYRISSSEQGGAEGWKDMWDIVSLPNVNPIFSILNLCYAFGLDVFPANTQSLANNLYSSPGLFFY